MIEKIEIDGIHMEVDENTRRYVMRKIGRLDKYLPKNAKESAHAEVMLKNKTDKKNKYSCEVTIYLPKETINVSESTISIFAAIDIVESKLHHQIQKYKDLHSNSRLSRHRLGRLRKKAAENP
jgi:ribosomal subunit interface protein